MRRCLASAGIFICLDVLWGIVAIGAVVGGGVALEHHDPCAGREPHGYGYGYGVTCSDIESAQTGMLIAGIIASMDVTRVRISCAIHLRRIVRSAGCVWRAHVLLQRQSLTGAYAIRSLGAPVLLEYVSRTRLLHPQPDLCRHLHLHHRHRHLQALHLLVPLHQLGDGHGLLLRHRPLSQLPSMCSR